MHRAPVAIRPAAPEDLPILQDIERAAGAAFVSVGMPEIAEDAPFTVEVLEAYRAAGRAWVASDHATPDRPVAYVLVDLLDDGAHVEQVSVHPEAGRRGIGAALIDHVADWARRQPLARLTLTTFREVPWNAPYYRRLGFAEVAPEHWSAALRSLVAHEAELGLDPAKRVVMQRRLT